MVTTLVELERREALAQHAPFDRAARITALSSSDDGSGVAITLRKLMVLKFYGEEYHYVQGKTMAPMNDTAEAQAVAVEFAKKDGWVQKKTAE